MAAGTRLAMDMTVLARLHAALDLVIETEEQLEAIDAADPTLVRARFLAGETRELLRSLLVRPVAAASGPGAAGLRAARRH